MANRTPNGGLQTIQLSGGNFVYDYKNKQNPTKLPPANSRKWKSLDPKSTDKIILNLEGNWPAKDKGTEVRE